MAAQDYYQSSGWSDQPQPHVDQSHSPFPPAVPPKSSKQGAVSPVQSPFVSPFDDDQHPAYSQQSFHDGHGPQNASPTDYHRRDHSSDDIALQPQHGQHHPQTAYHPGLEEGYQDGRQGKDHNRDARRRRRKLDALKTKSRIPWFVYLITAVQIGVFVGEIVRNSVLTKSPIAIRPQFNPFLGPSFYVQVNMGALYVPCMRQVQGLEDAKDPITFPCPNTTTTKTECTLSQLCGLSGVPQMWWERPESEQKELKNKPLSEQPRPHQWYRFIIPVFLHAGIVHIGINMLVQVLLGRDWERTIGTVRFAILYLCSGIFGFVMSGNFAGAAVASTGASGALFGIFALMVLDLFYTWSQRKKPWKDVGFLVICIVVTFFLGLLPGVDNFAHIGGFLMGLILGVCILHSPPALSERIGANEPPYTPVTAGQPGGDPNATVKAF
ncbi:MAG: hypothetical protein M1833_002265, partial [Piccolia ochrophora]